MADKLNKMKASTALPPQGTSSMPAGTNGAIGPYSMPGETKSIPEGMLGNLRNALKTPEMQKALLQGGLSMIENAQKRKQAEEEQLLKMLQQNPAEGLQGAQMGFSIPNMQSVNGLLGR